MTEFKLMEHVQWSSQAAGSTKTKTGFVVEIVPAEHRPDRNRFPDLYNGAGVGWGRNAVSYVVQVGKKHYWPRANALQPVVKVECPELLKLRESVRRLVGEFSQKRDEADKALNDAYGAGNYNQVHNRQGYKEAMTYVWRELSALIDGKGEKNG